jgi:peptidoglycan hydrolase-like protein with peptidoglycan-binding domain
MKHYITKHFILALAVLSGIAGTIALVPAQASAATSCIDREFANGHMDDVCVGYLQKMLNRANNAKLAVDNDYGPQTASAVRAWQQRVNDQFGDAFLVDGITGKQTWFSLCIEKARFSSTAQKAGCTFWKKDLATQVKTYGTINKPKKQIAVPVNATNTGKPCDEQIFSKTTRNKNTTCAHILQNMLNMAQNTNIDTTAAFGNNTRAAVKAFQRNAHVTNEAPGVVGKRTWAALCAYQTGNNATQATYNGLRAKAGCTVAS